MIFILISSIRRITAGSGIKKLRPLRTEDVVKGFEYDDDKYVVVTDEEEKSTFFRTKC
jgi:non-homologous end joining protein Ku